CRSIPPPTCYTLFPYTTLFRSLRGLAHHQDGFPQGRRFFLDAARIGQDHVRSLHQVDPGNILLRLDKMDLLAACQLPPDDVPDRSEEHTSELQSRVDLVCRLLL